MRALLLAAVLLLAGCAAPLPRGNTTVPGSGPVVPLQPTDSATWPQYSLDLAGTRFQARETALAAATVGSLRPLWNVTVGGAVTGTPIVARGMVFVGDWSGGLHAVDARTGAPRWNRTLEGGVTGTVAVAEGGLFVGDAAGFLYRLDPATGAERWRLATDPEPATHLYGSPLVHAGTVYLGVASDQHSVRLYPEPGPLTFRGSVIAVDAATGELRWRTPTQRAEDGLGGSVWASPVLDEASGTLFIGTGQAYTAPDGPRVDAMLALDARTGQVRWAFKATEGDIWTQRKPENPDWDFGSSPVLARGAGGRLLVVEAQKSSVVWARDAATGEAVWDVGEARGGQDIVASPAVKDGVLFLPTVGAKKVLALNLSDGALRWERDLGAALYSAAALVPGLVLVGTSDGHLVALDEATGEVRLRVPTGRGGVFGGISVADGVVYAAAVPKGFLGEEGALVAWGLP